MTIPEKEQAEAIFNAAAVRSPGAWITRSRTAARVAEALAKKCGMDAQRAYVLALLHDVGRCAGGEGVLENACAGYRMMLTQGWPGVARVCVTHKFACRDTGYIVRSTAGIASEDAETLRGALKNIEYDDYDRLIQLSDAMAAGNGICVVEKCMVERALRGGLDAYMLDGWRAIIGLKEYFDAKAGGNIYEMFAADIRAACG